MKTLDTTRIDDLRIGAVRPLINPALLQERVPLRDDTLELVERSRRAIAERSAGVGRTPACGRHGRVASGATHATATGEGRRWPRSPTLNPTESNP